MHIHIAQIHGAIHSGEYPQEMSQPSTGLTSADVYRGLALSFTVPTRGQWGMQEE